MKKDTLIYIAGHKGMVGSAVWRNLENHGFTNLIGLSSSELNLKNQQAVTDFFDKYQPEVVIDAAARVGGILANNDFPYNFLMENMQIQNNLIENSLRTNVQKFIFLGSSCIYPKFAPQPLKEEYLLTDSLEPTNEWYALAKISGVKLCEAVRKQFGKDFVSLMPTNLYGINDNFDLQTSHVLPAMIRKFHEAKLNDNSSVTLWGSGKPFREFLFVDDLADAVYFALVNQLDESLYNVGYGSDLSICDLALVVQQITGHTGEIIWDSSKPDGTPKKLMDISKLNQLGWVAKTTLKDGLEKTYEWFLTNNYKNVQIA
jgi:GDP-L-fucose synthase